MSPRSPSPLRGRDFRLFFVGQTTSTFGSSVASVALAFAVLQVTGSIASVGLALAATRVPLIVFVLLGGVAGDRLSRRKVMLASDAGRFATQATAALLLLTGSARLWELLVLFALHGLAQAFFAPAAVGLVPELVEAPSLQSANALLDFSRGGSGLVGQLAGGVLVTLTSPGTAFAVDSLTFLVSACALGALGRSGALTLAPAGRILHDLAEGWNEFRSRTWLWVGVVHIALLNAFALVSFFALGPVVAKRALGGGAAWGVVGASFAAGMMAGSMLALRWRPARPLLVAFLVVLFAAPQLAALAGPAPLAAVAFAAFFGGAQSSFWGALWTTTMQRDIPRESLARVAAYSQIGTLVLAPIGFVAVGLLAEKTSVAAVMWAGAVWILASTAIVVAVPSIRHYRAEPLPALARG
ncbi:MAG: MFS transporter [Gaiellaceae bacterium]